jgi:cobalamin biosynthesis Mg chelatase CobN
MSAMKRLLLLAVLAVAVTVVPSQAAAAGPCRNDIYDDWYQDGKVASTYPVACYRDAIKHVHGDLQIYSSLIDDIRAAMQAAISRQHGRSNVPAQVGKGVSTSETAAAPSSAPSQADEPTSRSDATNRSDPPVGVSTIAAPPVADSSDSSGVPLPLLVLGALALLLAGAGGIGMLARRRT